MRSTRPSRSIRNSLPLPGRGRARPASCGRATGVGVPPVGAAANSFAATTGYQTLEIWDATAGGLPSTRLCGGTWQSQATLPLGWQGANFDQVVQL